ncbi:MAG: KH domain-containing protein [Methanomassiliicoccales archaeon]
MTMMKIPKDRVGALIGKEGKTKQAIEEEASVSLKIDSDGEVRIYNRGEDPLMPIKVANLVQAVGRGFSPERAWRLLEDDEYLEVMDIREYVGKKGAHVMRMRSRVIGTKGKTRRIIENLSGASVSIYGSTVAIIANSVQLPVARKAVEMLLRGSEHSSVYGYLERQRDHLKISEMGFE